jgi:hypothetical protein
MSNLLDSFVTSANKYLGKAVEARELFYRGMDEAAVQARMERQPNFGVENAKYRWGKSVKASQLIADNKWHMAQARTFALMAIATGVVELIKEQKQTNTLLTNLDRNLDAIHDSMKEMQVY